MTLPLGLVLLVGLIVVLAARRRTAPVERGLGQVSQSWLAEERASNTRQS